MRQVGQRVFDDDAPVVDDHDLLTDLRDLGQDVGRQDHRALAGQLVGSGADLDDLARVEADRRLVEHQHAGVVDQRLGEADALPKALRQMADDAAGDLGQAAGVEDAVDAVVELRLGDAVDAADEAQVRW